MLVNFKDKGGSVLVKRAFIYIIIGAALWGTIGWYVKNLYIYGFTPMEVVTLRVSSSAMLLLIYMLFVSPNQLKLHTKTDIKYFLGTGILSIIFLIIVCSQQLNSQRSP